MDEIGDLLPAFPAHLRRALTEVIPTAKAQCTSTAAMAGRAFGLARTDGGK
jgi:hypothetical protein